MSEDVLTLKGLRALARDHVLLVPDAPGHDVATSACIRDVRSGRILVDGVPGDRWEGWYRAGLIVAAEDGPGYRLSQAGRIHLKRLMSRSDPGGMARAEEPAPAEEDNRGADTRGDSPLDWLRRRRDTCGRALISAVEFSAGERLRRDFALGQLSARTTMSWSPVRGGGGRAWRDGELTMSEAASLARERFRAALTAVGPDFASVLYDVCCAEIGLGDLEARSGWPRRSGKLVLQLALRALARHYGFSDAAGSSGVSARRAGGAG